MRERERERDVASEENRVLDEQQDALMRVRK